MKVRTIILLFFLLATENLFSQGGGPPMLTTDPGTPGKNRWEINTLIGYHSANTGIQIPTVEIVYGIGRHYQISVQLPMPNIELNKSHYTTFTQPQMGVKCQILDEEKNFISFAVYPQLIIPLYKDETSQIFIPLEFEKTFNSFRIGEEFGYFVLNNPYTFFNGTIIGFQLKNNLELMGEFYFSKTLNKQRSTSGLLNFGFRKQFNKNFVLMSSIGTEVISPYNEDRDYLFGLIGVQLLLGN